MEIRDFSVVRYQDSAMIADQRVYITARTLRWLWPSSMWLCHTVLSPLSHTTLSIHASIVTSLSTNNSYNYIMISMSLSLSTFLTLHTSQHNQDQRSNYNTNGNLREISININVFLLSVFKPEDLLKIQVFVVTDLQRVVK